MIRKIVLLMLVFGFLVQGGNALESVVLSASGSGIYTGGVDTDTWIVDPAYHSQPVTVIYSMHLSKVTSDGCTAPNVRYLFGWIGLADGHSTCDGHPYSSSGIIETTMPASGNISVYLNTYREGAYVGLNYTINPSFASAIYAFSDTYDASGESCNNAGTYDIYFNSSFWYTDEDDGNYSFTSVEGSDYQIHFTHGNISEWHNFTASGDEFWNPPDTCNNADFNFINLAYTSPVKQYLTSNVTVDINDTDGTISSVIARIDGSNYSMQFIGGLKWRYLFTGTNIIKNYYITNIYATDNEGGQDSESYNASYIHVESRTGGGGGGGGSGDYPSDPTIPPSEPCTLNCDDDDDGTCDRNCDIDDDGICDVNCDDAADRPADEDLPEDFTDFFENLLDGKIPEDFWTDENLRIHPASLNSTAFYTGWDKPQNITYRFLTNKFIDSCEVTNGTCTIDQSFLVNFNTIINENTTGYSGILTVARTGETATADIKINVINLCACKEITPWQLNISDEWAQKLVYFVRVTDGAIVCIRWWFMIALLILLLGIVMYDSNRK